MVLAKSRLMELNPGHSDQTPPKLCGLPAEIIDRIFESITDDSAVFSARLTSKQVEKASFTHFGKRFFRKKGYMVTTPSLHVFKLVAAHDGLRKFVQHVWFNPDCYTFSEPASSEDSDPEYNTDQQATCHDQAGKERASLHAQMHDRIEAYKACSRDHCSFFEGDKLAIELTTAFGTLPNLATVGMRRSEDHNPYGWRALTEAIGDDPRTLGPLPRARMYELTETTKLFVAIVTALASADVRLERLYTDAVEIDNVLESKLPQRMLEKACASLLYLELNAVRGSLVSPNMTWPVRYKTLKDPADFAANLERFLAAAPKLREIGLQVFPDLKQRHLIPPTPRDTESWKLSYPYLAIRRVALRVPFRHLTRVKLEKFTTDAGILQRLLEHSAPSLTSLKFRDLRLLSSAEDPRPWQTVFTFLAAECTSLDHVLFYHLMYDRGGVSFAMDAPAPSSQEESYHVPDEVPSYERLARFATYEHITLRETGREAVRARLEIVKERHWYHKPLFSYPMDDGMWHTDTSDEEW